MSLKAHCWKRSKSMANKLFVTEKYEGVEQLSVGDEINLNVMELTPELRSGRDIEMTDSIQAVVTEVESSEDVYGYGIGLPEGSHNVKAEAGATIILAILNPYSNGCVHFLGHTITDSEKLN